ncbi:beta-ketoacyl synthase N-terminal-like domain-containing protein [Streptomyces daghestanicus]|uniref:Polyketide synthase n=1 Tax=Streptomyces daghestanicus TaxID=66885 RepID=A0ABQ3QCJ8_9ACTN|nr:beta-ketoacyl synthase N-terminal-like domain-containing protein [Streptomyces daghestanicus]GHI34974.1 hypothetical protein Sdagh_67040 [Streptomyces daghestanicus]
MSFVQQETSPAVDDPTAVAVVGASCRFGPLSSPAAYWDLLVRGETAVRSHGREELLALGHEPEHLERPGFVPAGCALSDADRFDAELFGFNPRQAEWLDPQQRLLLELAWSALEDAGLAPGDTPGTTGVFTSSARPTLPPVGITDLDAAGMARFSSADRDFTATRIAHRLGLTGPALTVQTACSSSLVGVHLAVESLLGEECDTALVGAVSLHLPQAGYPSSPGMILSPSGVCRPFDARADGTVFGNGGGAVVLRRLADALRDGDPVRAVVRGTAVNNDGADRQDYQAPSPRGQAAALSEALAVGAVAPGTVGLVEAHGTGTPLGDPVEFSALREAYGDGPDPAPCALGSAKSVVGHLNTAAGLAGLLKCVLALEQGIVPPQHGYETPNPLLGLATSRFFVPRTPQPWPVPRGPRRAAVSSFGIGGTNAHVVLEQAPPVPARDPEPAAGPVPLVLSARTPQALRASAERLAGHLESPDHTDSLDAVARTLREGRSRLPCRLAVVARDPADAARVLRERAAGGAADEPATAVERAARAWEAGETDDVPVTGPRAGRPRRARLPGYPFDHSRSWPLGAPRDGRDGPAGRRADGPRGMVDRNTSTLRGISFERDLDPGEPLLADHVVAGRPVLPAAAFMEFVRAVSAAAAGAPPRRLEDLTFRQPAEAGGPLVLRAEVSGDETALTVTVTSAPPAAGAGTPESRVHVTARVPAPTDPAAAPAPPPAAVLAALRERCPSSLAPADLYALFARHSVHYGPLYQVVTDFSYGERDVVARVSSEAAGGTAGTALPPALLDGALQTVMGFLAHGGGASERYLPFAVERLDVYGPLPAEVVVHARPRRLAGGGARVRKFDLTLYDPDGGTRAELTGLALRPTVPAGGEPPAGGPAVRVLAPTDVPLPPARRSGPPVAPGPLVVLGGGPSLRDAVTRHLGPATGLPEGDAAQAGRRIAAVAGGASSPGRPVVVWLGACAAAGGGPDTAVERLRDAVALLRELLRPLARTGAVIRVPYPAGDPGHGALGAGLAALGRSLARENPRFDLCAVGLPDGFPDDRTAAVLAAEAGTPAPGTRHVLVDAGGGRRTPVLRPAAPRAGGGPGLRERGRYWINGHGRLAALLAEHLLTSYRAEVLLTGRRDRTSGDPAWERLRALAARTGGSVEHLVADTTDAAALAAVAARLTAEGRPPHGVFHCAGVLRDGFLLTKDPAAAVAVAGPKVRGTAALDAATAGFDLDFFVAYSSVSAALGSEGQADYAFANAAMDRIAVDRAAAVRAGTRTGRTLSVAWPYWADGGMEMPGDPAELLAPTGAVPLPARTGLDVLETLLRADPDGPVCPLVFYGDPAGPPASLLPGPDAHTGAVTGADHDGVDGGDGTAAGPPPVRSATGDGTAPEDPLLAVVRGVLAEVTGHPLRAVAADTLFDDLGIDSLTGIRAVERLSERFGRLPRTLLFECRSAAEIVAHLRAEVPESRLEHAAAPGPDEQAPPSADVPAGPPVQILVPVPVPARGDGTEHDPAAGDDGAVAVIGIAGRFPQADGLEEFWRNLLDGRDCVTEIPADRWPLEGFFRPERDRPNTSYAKWGGFLDGIDRFDAPLFNISAREAGTVDPQARLFLESCWAAMEDAGYTPSALAPDDDPRRPRDVGVYVGAMYSEYQVHEGEERLRGNPVHANSAFWCIANRVSYFFGFEGPSIALDTACSSGLSSLHTACRALRAGDCAVALAGAVNVTVHPNKYLMLSQGRFLSSDGRCRSFGAGGDGYVPGEGVAAVVLKPLAAALRDGDQIHAVIRGSAVNHGGRTNGYTVPNPRAQANLVGRALADAGLTAWDLDYVEAHGTGTALGDPLEIRGLASAFGRDGRVAGADPGGRDPHCPIGSVKSNIGHLESAAGMAAFAKVLLQFRHRTLVPSLHADPPNPEIDFAATPFTVQRRVAAWEPARAGGPAPLRAGISSFGAGGSNAHVVVEEGPRRGPAPADDGRPLVAFLSARTPAALAELAGRLRRYLVRARAEGTAPARADVTYTLAVGRAQLGTRAAVRHRDEEELLAGLARIESGGGAAGAGEQDPAAEAWLGGGRADLAELCGAAGRGRRVTLPHYPFERIRCWYDNQLQRPDDAAGPREGTDAGAWVRGDLRDFGRAPRPAPDTPPASPTPPTGPPVPTPAPPTGPPVPTPAPPTGPPVPTPAPPAGRPPVSTPAPEPVPVSVSREEPDPGPGVDRIRRTLLDILGEVLYEDPAAIGADRPFEEMGLDSLLTEELAVALRERLGLTLEVRDLYEHTTADRLARHLAASAPPAPDTGAESPDAVLDALASGGIGLEEAVSLLEASR